jgi:hypothetical protein
MRVAPITVLASCVWISDDAEVLRFDNDEDGFPFSMDCNDDAPSRSVLEGEVGTLGCGSHVEGVVTDGVDQLQYTQCLHPGLPGDLVVLRDRELAWEFLTDEATDVRVTLDAGQFVATGDLDQDNLDIPLIANRGRACAVERCVAALPSAPPAFRSGKEAAGWTPTLRFRAEAGESWFVVVSADEGAFSLDLTCGD